MTYLDLVQALRDEVAAEIHRIEEQSTSDVQRVLDEARAGARAERTQTLEQATAQAEADHRRALARAAQEASRAELLERERLLEGLRSRIAARLPTLRVADPLLAELGPELPDEPLEVVVAPADAALAVPQRARVVTDDSIGAGVLVRAGPVILDNTLASRLERLWPHVAPAVAKLLFGEAHGAL